MTFQFERCSYCCHFQPKDGDSGYCLNRQSASFGLIASFDDNCEQYQPSNDVKELINARLIGA